jgi:5-formyltetrahydrofolate cyclo-ligase
MAVPPPPPASDPPLDGKAAIRARLRSARRAFAASLDPSSRAQALAAIDRHLTPILSRPGSLAGYVAHRGEVDILPFLLKAFHLGRPVALPHVADGSENIHFVSWQPHIALQPGLAGIPQPESNGDAIVPTILLVPLVGFDRAGNRIGQGGGFYDRWFAAHPAAMRIGIAWSVQECEAITPDPWDMPLHAIVTEREWIDHDAGAL